MQCRRVKSLISVASSDFTLKNELFERIPLPLLVQLSWNNTIPPRCSGSGQLLGPLEILCRTAGEENELRFVFPFFLNNDS